MFTRKALKKKKKIRFFKKLFDLYIGNRGTDSDFEFNKSFKISQHPGRINLAQSDLKESGLSKSEEKKDVRLPWR